MTQIAKHYDEKHWGYNQRYKEFKAPVNGANSTIMVNRFGKIEIKLFLGFYLGLPEVYIRESRLIRNMQNWILFQCHNCIVANSPPLEGNTPRECPHSVPSPPRRTPNKLFHPLWLQKWQIMLNKLICSTKSPYLMSKSAKMSIKYMYIFYFCLIYFKSRESLCE